MASSTVSARQYHPVAPALDAHPFLAHYLAFGDPCAGTGTTGAWNSFTGDSVGWQPVAFDLSGYVGKQVEVLITFVTDPAFGGVGVFVDDTKVVAGGANLAAEAFEAGLGAWSAQRPPGAATKVDRPSSDRRRFSRPVSAPGTRCCSDSGSSNWQLRPRAPPCWARRCAR